MTSHPYAPIRTSRSFKVCFKTGSPPQRPASKQGWPSKRNWVLARIVANSDSCEIWSCETSHRCGTSLPMFRPTKIVDAVDPASEELYDIPDRPAALAPVVDLLRYVLTMLGKRASSSYPNSGLATYMARTITQRDLLFAVSFRFYGSGQCGRASGAEVPIIAISDSTLSPLAIRHRCFCVPEHEYTFSRSLAAPMCLAQALTVALAGRLQQDPNSPRTPTVTAQHGR